MQQTADPRKQVLVVEDEALIGADIQKRLERMGYSAPEVVSSGEEALRSARAKPFDLVLMDIRLSGDMDGIATAQTLKAGSDTPVVYITAHADRETVQRAKLTEPFGYILKPIADGDLSSAVEIAIYKHQMERRLRESEAWLSTTLWCVGKAGIERGWEDQQKAIERIRAVRPELSIKEIDRYMRILANEGLPEWLQPGFWTPEMDRILSEGSRESPDGEKEAIDKVIQLRPDLRTEVAWARLRHLQGLRGPDGHREVPFDWTNVWFVERFRAGKMDVSVPYFG